MKLSVIIPMYNAEKYIERCVESLYCQDLNIGDFEVLIINDGSTDHSLIEVENLARKHKNIVILSKKNAGAASARNLGIKNAKGDFLVFIDADDYYLPNCLKQLLNTCELKCLDLLYYRLLIHYEDGSISDALGGDYNRMPIKKIMSGLECYQKGFQASTMCGCMLKRKILTSNNLRFSDKRFGEDTLLSYCVTAYSKRVMFLNEAPYVYFKNKGSVLQKVATPLRLIQIENTLSVGHDVMSLSLQVDSMDLSRILKKYSVNIIFGAFWNLWKLRMIFKEEHLLYPFMDKLKTKGWYPMKGPFFSFKKWIVTHVLINNKYAY